MAKNNLKQPAKRKYVKRSPKWVFSTNNVDEPVINIIPQAKNMRDELDLLRDMLANFESMTEEARFRAYSYFTSKYSKYGTTF